MVSEAHRIFLQAMDYSSSPKPGVDEIFVLNNGDVSRPVFPLPQLLEKALRFPLDKRFYGYTGPHGPERLRKTIAAYEAAAHGSKVTFRNISITAGVLNGLDVLFDTLKLAGKEVLLPVPSYPLPEAQLLRYGADVKHVRTSRRNGFLPTVDELDASLTDRTAALALTTPNNPTGTDYVDGGLGNIYDWAEDRGVLLVLDEIFADLMLHGNVHERPSYDPEEGHVVRLKGPSKDRGVAGFRIGYIVSSQEIQGDSYEGLGGALALRLGNASTVPARFIRDDMRMRRYGLPGRDPPEDKRADFDEYSEVIAGNIERYELNDRMFERILGPVSAVDDIVVSQGGFTKFVHVAGVHDTIAFCQDLYANTGVRSVPGEGFNMHELGWIRLTFSRSPKFLEKGLETMAAYLSR